MKDARRVSSTFVRYSVGPSFPQNILTEMVDSMAETNVRRDNQNRRNLDAK